MKLVLEIQSLGHKGLGIGRHRGKVVMVPFGAPGDKLEVKIVRSHKSYDEARILKLLEPSSQRRHPPCPYYGTCGGCQLQHLEITHQRAHKERILKEILKAQAGIEAEKVLPMLWDPLELGYRCRMDLHVLWKQAPRLAFASRGSSELIPVRRCLLAMEQLNSSIQEMELLLSKARCEKLMRVEMTCDESGHARTFLLSTSGRVNPSLLGEMASWAPNIEGLSSLCVGRARGGKVWSLWSRRTEHEGVLLPILNADQREVPLKVWPGVFAQVNPRVNRILTQTMASWTRQMAPESILDLYAGMGNLTFAVAGLASRVTAVEVNPRAVANAMANSRELGVQNVTWILGSAPRELSRMAAKALSFDLVILDPPRSGAWELLDTLASIRPKAVIYVSCEPSTLARDLSRLQSRGYRVDKVQPLDMFPQTFHLESISLLREGTS